MEKASIICGVQQLEKGTQAKHKKKQTRRRTPLSLRKWRAKKRAQLKEGEGIRGRSPLLELEHREGNSPTTAQPKRGFLQNRVETERRGQIEKLYEFGRGLF